MSIKPAFLFIVSINIKSNSGKHLRIPLPIPLIIFLSLATSVEELLDFSLLFVRGHHRSRLKLTKAAATALRLMMLEIMFTMGPYDFVRIDAGDAGDQVRIRIHTK